MIAPVWISELNVDHRHATISEMHREIGSEEIEWAVYGQPRSGREITKFVTFVDGKDLTKLFSNGFVTSFLAVGSYDIFDVSHVLLSVGWINRQQLVANLAKRGIFHIDSTSLNNAPSHIKIFSFSDISGNLSACT